MPKSRGFTLVELLVSISIIAILTVIGLVMYNQATMNARDARRKQDLQHIAQALEVYYQKNGQYPASGVSGRLFSNTTTWITGLAPDYINSVPIDPKNNYNLPTVYMIQYDLFDSNNEYYGYAFCSKKTSCYGGCNGIEDQQWYILTAKLENRNDPDRSELKNNKSCDGRSLTGSAGSGALGYSRYLYIITPSQ